MKSILKGAGIVLAFIIVLAIATPSNDSSNETSLESQEEVTPELSYQAQDSIRRAQRMADSLELVGVESEMNTLKRKLTFKEDEFEGTAWFYPRTINPKYWPNRKTVYAYGSTKGYAILVSNYHASDWVFHDHIQVKIGEEVYTTGKIESYDKSNRTDNSGGGIWENVQYDRSRDNGVLNALASAEADEPVKVRFIGRQYRNDQRLYSADVQAIKDVYRMAELYKKKDELEEKLKETQSKYILDLES